MGMEPPRNDSNVLYAEDLEQFNQEQVYSSSGGNLPDEKDRDLVDWDGPNDPGNPHNWPKWKKALCTVSMGTLNFCVTFSSSVITATVKPLVFSFLIHLNRHVLGGLLGPDVVAEGVLHVDEAEMPAIGHLVRGLEVGIGEIDGLEIGFDALRVG